MKIEITTTLLPPFFEVPNDRDVIPHLSSEKLQA